MTRRLHRTEVLVVDDEVGVRWLLRLVLQRRGFTVWSAANCPEAVEAFQKLHPTIDVVLLDVQMPGMDGPATLAALQKTNPQVKCCFMTSDTGRYSEDELLAMGASHVIQKPFIAWDSMVQRLSELAEMELSQSR